MSQPVTESSDQSLENSATASGSKPEAEKERTARNWILPALLVLMLLGSPLLINALFSGASTGWAVLITYGVFTGVLAFVDGLTFRSSWTFPALTGIGFWVASQMYFPGGTWIYIFLLMLLAWALGKLGEALSKKKGA